MNAARAVAAALLTPALALLPAHDARAAEWRWNAARVVDYTRVNAAQISPDGRWVVYALTRPRAAGDKPGAAYANLWVVPFEGGPARQITSANAEDKAPAWSPDGTRIAFLSARGGEDAKTRVWVMALAGGEPRALTGEKLDAQAFAWSPDGRRIAFVRGDAARDQTFAGPGRAMILDVASGRVTRVPITLRDVRSVAWAR